MPRKKKPEEGHGSDLWEQHGFCSIDDVPESQLSHSKLRSSQVQDRSGCREGELLTRAGLQLKEYVRVYLKRGADRRLVLSAVESAIMDFERL